MNTQSVVILLSKIADCAAFGISHKLLNALLKISLVLRHHREFRKLMRTRAASSRNNLENNVNNSQILYTLKCLNT